MSIIFVFLVKDCEKQVSNCIFDTCFAFSQRSFSRGIARFSLWRRNGLHKPQNAFGVKAVRKAHFAVVVAHFQPVTICNSFISLCAKYARLNYEYRQNADSVFAVGNLSVRYPTTYKKFDRTEWCRFAPSQSIIEPRKPPIIITDAPSSNLDRATDRRASRQKCRQRFCCRHFVGA